MISVKIIKDVPYSINMHILRIHMAKKEPQKLAFIVYSCSISQEMRNSSMRQSYKRYDGVEP